MRCDNTIKLAKRIRLDLKAIIYSTLYKVPYLYSIFLRLCLRGLRLVVTGDICLNMRLCSWDRCKAYRSKALPNRSSETTATAGFLKSIILSCLWCIYSGQIHLQ